MATTLGTPLGSWVEEWLSAPRFQRYLDAVGGDRALALELYEWNADAAAAVIHDVAHLEVALRNAYDRVLSGASTTVHWTDPASGLFLPCLRTRRASSPGHGSHKVKVDINVRIRESLERARRSAGVGASTGKVIAEPTFGFWRYLTTAAQHDPLWIPCLRHAFPAGTSRPEVHDRVSRLHRLRNRAAPHEHLLAENLPVRSAELRHVASLLGQDIGHHVAAHSRIAQLPTRPVSTSADDLLVPASVTP